MYGLEYEVECPRPLDQEEDQRGPGESLYERFVKHVNEQRGCYRS